MANVSAGDKAKAKLKLSKAVQPPTLCMFTAIEIDKSLRISTPPLNSATIKPKRHSPLTQNASYYAVLL